MTWRKGVILRLRLFAGLMLSGALCLFGTNRVLVMVLDVLASKFADFRGRSE